MTAKPGQFSLADLLGLLLQAIERINEDISGLSKAEFLADTKRGRQVRDAVVLNLGTMGEIAGDIRRLFPDFATQVPAIPLDRMWDMRSQLFHGYHSINYEIVWTTCRSSVADLERHVRAAIAGFGPES